MWCSKPTAQQIRDADGQTRVSLLSKASDDVVVSLRYTAAERRDLVNIAADAEFEIRKARRELRNSRTSFIGLIIAIIAVIISATNAYIQYWNHLSK